MHGLTQVGSRLIRCSCGATGVSKTAMGSRDHSLPAARLIIGLRSHSTVWTTGGEESPWQFFHFRALPHVHGSLRPRRESPEA